MDADALVKLTKAGAKELVTSAFSVVIPELVRDEVVTEGKELGHVDGLQVEDNIRLGKIQVVPAMPEHGTSRVLTHAKGDRALLSHATRGRYAAVVTDDAALLNRLKTLGISATVPAALLLAAGRRRRLAAREIRSFLDELRPHISSEEYVTCILTLERRYPLK